MGAHKPIKITTTANTMVVMGALRVEAWAPPVTLSVNVIPPVNMMVPKLELLLAAMVVSLEVVVGVPGGRAVVDLVVSVGPVVVLTTEVGMVVVVGGVVVGAVGVVGAGVVVTGTLSLIR